MLDRPVPRAYEMPHDVLSSVFCYGSKKELEKTLCTNYCILSILAHLEKPQPDENQSSSVVAVLIDEYAE